jgi:hypothetical protein
MIHVKRQAFARDLFALHVQGKVTEILMTEKVRVCFNGSEKSLYLSIVNKRRLGMGRNTSLYMTSNCDPLENVNAFSSTLVKLYREMHPSRRAAFALTVAIGSQGNMFPLSTYQYAFVRWEGAASLP